MTRKTARVALDRRQADIYEFLRVLKCFIWMAVCFLFFRSQKRYLRHGVAVCILDVRTGEFISPTPHTFGVINDTETEHERREKCRRKCELLLARPELSTSSQISEEDGGAIRICRGTSHELIVGLAGLGSKLNEAVAYAASLQVWDLPQEERVSIIYRQGIGPNTETNDTTQYHDILKMTRLQDKDYKDFNPDFDELDDFERYIV